jgi:uncharacterized protein YjbJ (UPF0337 family)
MKTKRHIGNWEEYKPKLIKKFAHLTDKDFLFDEGKKEGMFLSLQKKLGISKEELLKIISGK